MKKGKYFIRLLPADSNQVKIISGYIDKDRKIGYYNNGDGYFTATDLESGLLIKTSKTLTQTVKDVDKEWPAIMRAKNSYLYKDSIKSSFRRSVKSFSEVFPEEAAEVDKEVMTWILQ